MFGHPVNLITFTYMTTRGMLTPTSLKNIFSALSGGSGAGYPLIFDNSVILAR